jgi:hypothetical protein
MSKKHVEKKPAAAQADAARSEAAWRALEREIEAIAAGSIVPRRAPVLQLVSEAMRIAEDIGRPEVRARFARLPADEFDVRHVDRLGLAALALFWANGQFLSVTSKTTVAKLPTDLAERATERKKRMFTVLEYHCAHIPAVVAELDDIRAGTGYADLSNDLMRLASLYRDHHDEIAGDTRHYRAGDEAGARADAEEITRLLRASQTSAEREWSGRVARAWTLLWTTYEQEIRPAAQFLFRRDPDVGNRFPSLLGAVRVHGISGDAKAAEGEEKQDGGKDGEGEKPKG